MTTRAPFLSFVIPALVVLLISSCSAPDAQDTASANLIVPGERIGDLPVIGTAGTLVRAMDFDEVIEFAGGNHYRWLDDTNEAVRMLFVCASNDEVSVVYIYNKPGNERFKTVEGIGIQSSEAEVIAALGDPDSTFEWEDNRQLRYFTTDDVPGLVISFKIDALQAAFGLWVGQPCE